MSLYSNRQRARIRVDDPVRDSDWRTVAACRGEDPELWFAVGTSGPALLVTAEAKRICGTCPSRVECLEWALERGETGVWAGLDEDERRSLKRRRDRERAKAGVAS